jgi:hypothetical protein
VNLVSRSPATNPGSFEVIGSGGAARTVLIYWQRMGPQEHNGPDFHIQVVDFSTNGDSASPTYVKKAHARFDNVSSDTSHTVSVRAANSAGAADDAARVVVPRAADLIGLAPRSLTKIYREAGRFQIAWRPPAAAAASTLVLSYTLFWCLAEDHKDRPYQCDGPLEWKTIPGGGPAAVGNETVTHDLLLPTTNVYQVAVSANTEQLSSGTRKTVFRIYDILVWIRIRISIRRSMPLTNGSGSCYFRH